MKIMDSPYRLNEDCEKKKYVVGSWCYYRIRVVAPKFNAFGHFTFSKFSESFLKVLMDSIHHIEKISPTRNSASLPNIKDYFLEQSHKGMGWIMVDKNE